MGWVSRLFGRRTRASRGFDGARSGRLSGGWQSQVSYDQDIRQSLATLRGRSRELAQNNDYVKRFLALLNTHVVGPKGVTIRCSFKTRAGEIDTPACDQIEQQFRLWSKRGSADVTGRFSWREIQRLVLQGVARDGEAIVRVVYGATFPFGIALQVIDPALLADLNEGANENH